VNIVDPNLPQGDPPAGQVLVNLEGNQQQQLDNLINDPELGSDEDDEIDDPDANADAQVAAEVRNLLIPVRRLNEQPRLVRGNPRVRNRVHRPVNQLPARNRANIEEQIEIQDMMAGQNQKLKFTDLMPPDFKGDGSQTAREWLEKFNRYMRVHNLSNEIALRRLEYFLTGIAYTWFKSREFDTVDEFMQAFTQQFGKYHSRRAMVDALNSMKLTPGMSVMKYLTDIQDLVETLGLGPESTIDAFTRGLPASIQDTITILPYEDNLDQLVDTVQKLTERDSKTSSTFDIGIPQYQQALSLSMAEINTQMKEFTIDVEKAHDSLALSLERSQKQLDSAISQQQSAAEKKTETMSQGNSNQQGKQRHERDERSSRGRGNRGRYRNQGDQRENFRKFEGNCYSCGVYGHRSAECRNRKRGGRSYNNYPNHYSVPYQQGYQNDFFQGPPQYSGFEGSGGSHYPPIANQNYGLPQSIGYNPYPYHAQPVNQWDPRMTNMGETQRMPPNPNGPRGPRAPQLSLTGNNSKPNETQN